MLTAQSAPPKVLLSGGRSLPQATRSWQSVGVWDGAVHSEAGSSATKSVGGVSTDTAGTLFLRTSHIFAGSASTDCLSMLKKLNRAEDANPKGTEIEEWMVIKGQNLIKQCIVLSVCW